jgi:hypothetical protein
MASTYTSWYQFPPTGIKPMTSSFPRSALTPLLPTKYQATSPPSPHAHEFFLNVNIPYQQSLTPLNRRVKNQNFEVRIFKVNARVAYVLVVKISDFILFY